MGEASRGRDLLRDTYHSRASTPRRRFIPLAVACLILAPAISAAPYRIIYNPYTGVDWQNDHRALSQHHDHAGTDEARIRAYDAAGYDVMPIMHYSGDPSVSGSWTQVRWPVADYLPAYNSDEEFLATLDHTKMIYPSAEKIGFSHIIAPFLTVYTEKYDPATHPDKLPHHYASTQECIDRTTTFGGLAIIAHPWATTIDYLGFEGMIGMEIYSAFAQHRFETGEWADRNAQMLQLWDTALTVKSSRIWGFAVNDWFGPAWSEASTYPSSADSGKTLVMLSEFTLKSYRSAIEAGSFFAVRDTGIIKRQYPTVTSITTTAPGIEISTADPDDAVAWFANAGEVALGATLDLDSLPPGLRYVRAQISNGNGTLYTQPFSLAGPGDFEANGYVDLRDVGAFQICFGDAEAACTAVFDCNEDGVVNELDLGTFELNMTGPRH